MKILLTLKTKIANKITRMTMNMPLSYRPKP